MIRIGFGTRNISVGYGPDLNLEAIIEAIRTAIGTNVMKETTVITAPLEERMTRVNITKAITTRIITIRAITIKTATSTESGAKVVARRSACRGRTPSLNEP